jgi:hypothetical protein
MLILHSFANVSSPSQKVEIKVPFSSVAIPCISNCPGYRLRPFRPSMLLSLFLAAARDRHKWRWYPPPLSNIRPYLFPTRVGGGGHRHFPPGGIGAVVCIFKRSFPHHVSLSFIRLFFPSPVTLINPFRYALKVDKA